MNATSVDDAKMETDLIGNGGSTPKPATTVKLSTKKKDDDSLQYINPDMAGYRFDEFNDKAMKYLDDHGYVVIKNILNPKEIIQARILLWDLLGKLGWDPNDITTWKRLPGETINGLLWVCMSLYSILF